MVSATTDPDRSGDWLHLAFIWPVSSHTERRQRIYSAASVAPDHHAIYRITVIIRKNCFRGCLNDDADPPRDGWANSADQLSLVHQNC